MSDLNAYKNLTDATSGLHYWHVARHQYADEQAKAERSVAHADERIADYVEKMNDALVALGFANAPDAEVPHE